MLLEKLPVLGSKWNMRLDVAPTGNSQTADKPIQATVKSCNCSSMYVHCLNCEKIHCHGFTGDHTATHRRQSRPLRLQDSVPIQRGTGDVGCEIYKQRALFVAGGADPAEYFLGKDGGQLASFTPQLLYHSIYCVLSVLPTTGLYKMCLFRDGCTLSPRY
jgi:hypothetical protein